MLFLDYGEPLKYVVSNMDKLLERSTVQCKLLANNFNEYQFNKYGIEDKIANLEK